MKFSLFALLFIIVLPLFAQQGDGGEPHGYIQFLKSGAEIPSYEFDQPNIDELRAEDEINDSLFKGPWRFGYNHEVSINVENSAAWFTQENGDQLGFIKITSEEAQTINLSFINSRIPEDNELYIYNPSKDFILGKFTSKHIYQGQLGTELVPGSTVILEYFVPQSNSNNIGNLEIAKITHGYRTAQEIRTRSFGSSGSCNMNVNCPDGAPFVNQRNSALMIITSGNLSCSGALINNTEFDGTPYVLTANHCNDNNQASWVFRFNWQSDDCNNPTSSPSFESLSGSVLRANRSESDFLLVEITGGLSNGTVPQSHSPYFAGWNNEDIPPLMSFSIHHPLGDIKKISFDDDPSVAVQAMNSTEANSSWKVIWDRNTTTQSASSGASLFNQEGKIIGQLWGGNASCDPTSLDEDYFGRIHNSWEPTGSTSSNQLKHWLDPNNSGVGEIIGFDPYNTPLNDNVSIISLKGYNDNLCADSYTPELKILNLGANTLTSLNIMYSYNGTVQTMNWTGSLSTYSSSVVQLPSMTQVDGQNNIEIQLLDPNGTTDQDPSDNQIIESYDANPSAVSLDFDFYLGCYGEEVSWKLIDENNAILYEGDDYSNGNTSNLVSENFCLLEGCYELILEDDNGDGVEGAAYNECDYSGSMTLTQTDNGSVLAELLEANANFGSEISFNFCVEDVSLAKETLEKNVLIYPNPSNGYFTIDMNFAGQKTIEIRSIAGQIISIHDTNSDQLKVNNAQLSSGIYLVNISSSSNSITRKVIIE